jgi:hypothetical protein
MRKTRIRFFLSDISKRAFHFYKVPSLSGRSFRQRFKLFTVIFAIRNPHIQDYGFQILWFAASVPRFLASLRRFPSVKQACRFVNIGRRTAYDARDRDEAFAAAWNEAISASIDEVEAKVMEAGLKGDMNVAMFLLRCHKRSVYGDVSRMEIDQRMVGVLVVPEKEQKDP